MRIIEITEDKFEELSENVEKMLRYGGKVMSCVDTLKRKHHMMHERNNMDYRDGGYMNERDDERYRYEQEETRMNERGQYALGDRERYSEHASDNFNERNRYLHRRY